MLRFLAVLTAILLVACGDDPVLTPAVPTNISRIGNEVGTPGWLLSDGLSVEVRDDRGEPLEGITVEWSSTEEGAWFGAASSETDVDGVATVAFAPGWRVGEQQVRATIGALHQDVVVASTSFELTEVATSTRRSACGLDPDGTVWCWNTTGGPTRFEAPHVLHGGARPVIVDAEHQYHDVVIIGLPGYQDEYCALTDAMQMRCWGFNDGVATAVSAVDTPVPFVSLTAAEWYPSVCGLDTTGQAWCRGANAHGQLGDGTSTDRAEFAPVAGAQRFKHLATQGTAFCGVDTEDLVWCWGTVGPPRPVVLVPTRMAGATPMRQLAFPFGSPCGIGLLDQRLYCWWGGGMEGVPATGTDAGAVPAGTGMAELSGVGSLGVFRWTDGHLGFTGDMAHDVGVNRFVTRPSDLSVESNTHLPTLPGGFEAILTRGGEWWCGSHQGGATLCSYRIHRLVGVPAPQ